MQLTGRLCTRFGAGRVTAAGTGLLAALAVLPGLAGTLPGLCGLLLVFGAATGLVNVAANSAGVAVESLQGRALLPTLHAGVSFGGLAGAGLGALAAALGPVWPHLAAVGVIGAVTAALTRSALRGLDAGRPAGHADTDALGTDRPTGHTNADEPGTDRPTGHADTNGTGTNRPTGHAGPDAQSSSEPPGVDAISRSRRSSRPTQDRRDTGRAGARKAVVLLGAVAGCTAFGEGALTDWGALHLTSTLGASPALAAAGYGGFSLAMAVARLGGTRLLRLLGETTLLVLGAVVAALGMITALTTTWAPLAIAGFVVVGLGLANLFPLTIARAGALNGSSGVALASTVGYTGLLGGPPVIGFVAEHAGLPAALAIVPVLSLAAGALVVADRRPRIVLASRIALPARTAVRRLTGPALTAGRHFSGPALTVGRRLAGPARSASVAVASGARSASVVVAGSARAAGRRAEVPARAVGRGVTAVSTPVVRHGAAALRGHGADLALLAPAAQHHV